MVLLYCKGAIVAGLRPSSSNTPTVQRSMGASHCWRDAALLLPHPGPLPRGEGEPQPVAWRDRSRCCCGDIAVADPKRGNGTTHSQKVRHGLLAFPLPWGEGQGEGESGFLLTVGAISARF